MKCVYCKKDYPLSDWGEHSQACEDRKKVRAGKTSVESDISSLDGTPSATADFIQIDIDDMSKDQLLDYLALEEIEHDPKAKKYQLKKLAKGE